MIASVAGSDDWWAVVTSMPLTEQMDYISAYRSTLVQIDRSGVDDILALHEKIGQCNTAIRRIKGIQESSRWRTACQRVLDPDVFELVIAEKIRLEELE